MRLAAEKGDLKHAQEALRKQEINRQQFAHLSRVAHGLRLLDTVKGFSYPEVKQVWDVATPAERKQLRPALVRSASHALETMPMAQRRGLITEVRVGSRTQHGCWVVVEVQAKDEGLPVKFSWQWREGT